MKTEKLFNNLLIIIATFPLIGMRFTVIIIILWCIVGFYLFIRDKLYLDFLKKLKLLLFLTSYYLLSILSLVFFTNNYTSAFKSLETKAAFIIFPLFLYSCRSLLKDRTLFKILISFALANTLLALYVWGIILNEGLSTLIEKDSYYYPAFRLIFSDSTNIHLPYLGLLFSFSILILAHFLVTKKIQKIYMICISLSIMILFLSMFIFSARMAIFSLFVVFSFYLIKKIGNSKKIIITLTCLVTIICFLCFLPPIKRRINIIQNIKFELPNSTQKSHEVNFRYGIYYCSFKVLKKHWLLGTGLGSMQDKLNNCYDNFDYRNYDDFRNRQYNCHNQFLNDWLTYGVLGLLILLIFLGYGFVTGDLLYKSFILLVTIALLTESLFEREIGVVFFTLFNSLFFIKKNIISETNKLIGKGL